MQTPQPESSSRAPGAGVGDCKTYPVAYNAAGVLDILEAMPMRALFFERTDDTLNHAVLLRAVRRDELLAQPVASRQRGVAARREDQSVVRSQQERRRHAPQCSETGDQGVFQGTALLATDGIAWIRGLKPIGRLRTCQPISWNTRCTVFLLNPTDAQPSGSQTTATLQSSP